MAVPDLFAALNANTPYYVVLPQPVSGLDTESSFHFLQLNTYDWATIDCTTPPVVTITPYPAQIQTGKTINCTSPSVTLTPYPASIAGATVIDGTAPPQVTVTPYPADIMLVGEITPYLYAALNANTPFYTVLPVLVYGGSLGTNSSLHFLDLQIPSWSDATTISCTAPPVINVLPLKATMSAGTTITQTAPPQVAITPFPATLPSVLPIQIDCTTPPIATLTPYPASMSAGKTILGKSPPTVTLTPYPATIGAGAVIECTAPQVAITPYPATISAGQLIECTTTPSITITPYPASVDEGVANWVGVVDYELYQPGAVEYEVYQPGAKEYEVVQ